MKRSETVVGLRRSQAIGGLRARRYREAGQSAIIAVIVLFLLLFLGAAFIALIANNLNDTRRSAITSESGRYSEAGIHYLDEQLTDSAQGADWRPTPTCSDVACTAGGIAQTDPDYFWLQYYHYDANRLEYVGGYTRVNFGGPTPTTANAGGRALVRLTYRPDVYTADGQLQQNTNNQYPDPNYTPDPSHKFIKLESVGRTGQIDPTDPTTFQNTNGLGLRVELTAYKQIGLNEYVRQIYNKDNKPDSFALGAPAPVQDVVLNNGTPTLVTRKIESIFDGPIRVNGGVTFYGTNRILLNPNRDDALLVSGMINEYGVSPQSTTAPTTNGNDPTDVYVYNSAGYTYNTTTLTSGTQTALYPSLSPDFTTIGGLVRDNPHGSDVLQIPYPTNGSNADQTNANLRGVVKVPAPQIDNVVGPNNETRYQRLTRDSPPLPAAQVGGTTLPTNAGSYGWGTGLYVNNPNDIQDSGPLSSPRAEWMNPTNYGGDRPWRSDSAYEPYAVDINLTPGYMVMTDKGQNTAQGSYFQTPTATITVKNGATTSNVTTNGVGSYLPQLSIVRYSGATAPSDTSIPDGTPVLPGYPTQAMPNVSNTYTGDLVIYAEGNVRIHGIVGGLDSQNNTYIRHITVVSNGIIYIDGDLLRDNLPSTNALHGVSSIALLAKNYVTVNTTQFIQSSNSMWKGEQDALQPPFSRVLNATPGTNTVDFHLAFGPMDRDNTPLTYPAANGGSGATTPAVPTIFLRDAADIGAAAGGGGQTTASDAAVQLALNPVLTATLVYFQFNQSGAPDTATLLLPSTPIQSAATGASEPGFNDQVYFATGVNTLNQTIGATNDLQFQYDNAASQEDYLQTRFGVAPLEIRVEAMMYAQNGSFFIIPGPWFNPSADDTLANYLNTNSPGTLYRRAGESTAPDGTVLTSVNPYFPFNGQPMDIRLTFYGTIAENEPAEIGDQGAWMEKWGWVPNYWGSSVLPTAGQTGQTQTVAGIASQHGPYGNLQFPMNQSTVLNSTATGANGEPAGGNGIVYQFDDRATSPYYNQGSGIFLPIRPDTTKIAYVSGGTNVYMPLPLTPNLPVAPGLLYFGEDTNVPQ